MDFASRRLPHLYVLEHPIFITFCLHDSFPKGRPFPRKSMTSGKAFVCMDRLLESQRSGAMFLRLPPIASLVAAEIQRGHPAAYDLHAWVIMPNHVHMLITPHGNVSALLRRLKGSTARSANVLPNRAGQPFWQNESDDHLVRDGREFRRIQRYIENNPVTAGLVHTPEEYPWSSASGLKPAAGSSLPHAISARSTPSVRVYANGAYDAARPKSLARPD